MKRLEGHRAVITGASGNLGGAVLEAFLCEGCRVVAVAGSSEGLGELARVADAHPGACAAVMADVTTPQGVAELHTRSSEFFGAADILVNLVGGYAGGKDLWEQTPDEWHHMLDLNLTSAFLCCRAFLGGMVEGGYGRVVNVSSRAASSLRPGQSAYTVAKAGVAVLTEVLREELKGTGVSVAAVAPSVIDGPAMRAAMPKADPARWVTPADLARVLLWLCTEEGGQAGGGVIPVYGGM